MPKSRAMFQTPTTDPDFISPATLPMREWSDIPDEHWALRDERAALRQKVRSLEVALVQVEYQIRTACKRGLPQGEQRAQLRALCQERATRRRAYWRAGWQLACRRYSAPTRAYLRARTCRVCAAHAYDPLALLNGVCEGCRKREQSRRSRMAVRQQARGLCEMAQQGGIVVISATSMLTDDLGFAAPYRRFELGLVDPQTGATLLATSFFSRSLFKRGARASRRAPSSTDAQPTHRAAGEVPQPLPEPLRTISGKTLVTAAMPHIHILERYLRQMSVEPQDLRVVNLGQTWRCVLKQRFPDLSEQTGRRGRDSKLSAAEMGARALWGLIQAVAAEPDEAPLFDEAVALEPPSIGE